MRIHERFEFFIASYPRADGTRWKMSQLAAASGGRLKSNYLSVLRAGKVASPGYDKLAVIANVIEGSSMPEGRERVAALLKAARRRTELELMKKTVDFSSGPSRVTFAAAIAVAAGATVADARDLVEKLTEASGVPLQEAIQQSPRRHRGY